MTSRKDKGPSRAECETARGPQYPHDRGYAATREDAMTVFKTAWEREP